MHETDPASHRQVWNTLLCDSFISVRISKEGAHSLRRSLFRFKAEYEAQMKEQQDEAQDALENELISGFDEIQQPQQFGE